MNDITLRCNIYECHRHLTTQAVVTTCSHLFCSDCANNLFTAERKCPSCQEPLMRPDDVVLANLDPTEDYKSSVLSGLAPDIIVDICRRAIDFWTYQASQELQLKNYELDKLRKNTSLVDQTLKIQVKDSKREIEHLKAQLSELAQERQLYKAKASDLAMQLQEKRQQHDKLQMAFDKIKRKGQQLMQPSAKDPTLGIGPDRRHSWQDRNMHSAAATRLSGPDDYYPTRPVVPLTRAHSSSLNARPSAYSHQHASAFLQPSPRLAARATANTRPYMPPETPVSVIRSRMHPARSTMHPF